MNSLFLPYDTYERHKRVGGLIGAGKSVIDVGGQLNLLANFSKVSKIVVANLEKSAEKSDVTIKEDKLPFKNNSFDVACAIDVLEHIPKDQRQGFIKELFRVSREKVTREFERLEG